MCKHKIMLLFKERVTNLSEGSKHGLVMFAKMCPIQGREAKMTKNVISVKPEDFILNTGQREINGEIDGTEFFVPLSEALFQDIKSEEECEPRKTFDDIQVGEIYEGEIVAITQHEMVVDINTFKVKVYVTDCTRSRMDDLREFFEAGKKVKVKILSKEKDNIKGSRKEAYPDIWEAGKNFFVGREIFVKTTERLNDDGYRVEITPNIPGIVNARKEVIDLIHRNQRLKVKIIKISEQGIVCKIANWQLN